MAKFKPLSREEYYRRRAEGASHDQLLYEARLEQVGAMPPLPTEEEYTDGNGYYAQRLKNRDQAAMAMRYSLASGNLDGVYTSGQRYLEAYKPNEWDGRSDAIAEYKRTRDPELKFAIQQRDIAAGNGLREYTWEDRAETAASALKEKVFAAWSSALAKTPGISEEKRAELMQGAEYGNLNAQNDMQWATSGWGFGGRSPYVTYILDRSHKSGKF